MSKCFRHRGNRPSTTLYFFKLTQTGQPFIPYSPYFKIMIYLGTNLVLITVSVGCSAHDFKQIGKRGTVLDCPRSDDKDREKGGDLAGGTSLP